MLSRGPVPRHSSSPPSWSGRLGLFRSPRSLRPCPCHCPHSCPLPRIGSTPTTDQYGAPQVAALSRRSPSSGPGPGHPLGVGGHPFPDPPDPGSQTMAIPYRTQSDQLRKNALVFTWFAWIPYHLIRPKSMCICLHVSLSDIVVAAHQLGRQVTVTLTPNLQSGSSVDQVPAATLLSNGSLINTIIIVYIHNISPCRYIMFVYTFNIISPLFDILCSFISPIGARSLISTWNRRGPPVRPSSRGWPIPSFQLGSTVDQVGTAGPASSAYLINSINIRYRIIISLFFDIIVYVLHNISLFRYYCHLYLQLELVFRWYRRGPRHGPPVQPPSRAWPRSPTSSWAPPSIRLARPAPPALPTWSTPSTSGIIISPFFDIIVYIPHNISLFRYYCLYST